MSIHGNSQSRYDGVVIYQDSINRKNTFIEGEEIYFFITVKNTDNLPKKWISVGRNLNYLPFTRLKNLDTGKEYVATKKTKQKLDEETIKKYEEREKRLIEIFYNEENALQPYQSKTKVHNKFFLFYDSNPSVYYPNIETLKSNDYPWYFSSGKYYAEISCYLGIEKIPISFELF